MREELLTYDLCAVKSSQQRGGGEYAVTAGSEAAGTDFRFQLIVRYNNILEFRLAAKNLPPWLNL